MFKVAVAINRFGVKSKYCVRTAMNNVPLLLMHWLAWLSLQHIKLTTSFFNVETDYSGETDSCDNGCTCPYDYVDVIEGSNVNAAPTDHLCGDVGPDGTYET